MDEKILEIQKEHDSIHFKMTTIHIASILIYLIAGYDLFNHYIALAFLVIVMLSSYIFYKEYFNFYFDMLEEIKKEHKKELLDIIQDEETTKDIFSSEEIEVMKNNKENEKEKTLDKKTKKMLKKIKTKQFKLGNKRFYNNFVFNSCFHLIFIVYLVVTKVL